MAEKPVKQSLPADLPENWTDSQYVSPGGTEVGLTRQHGFNYLMQQVNNVQKAAKEINDSFENLASLDPSTKKIPKEQLPGDMNYQTKTENLPAGSSLAMSDTVPFFSTQNAQNQKITISDLKNALGVQSPVIAVTALDGTAIVCTNGVTTLNGTGTTEFSVSVGEWTVTATIEGRTISQTVTVSGVLRYTVDMRIATEITVTSLPTKVSYIVGEAINITGAVITAVFIDGTTQNITESCNYAPTVAQEGVTAITFTTTLGGEEFMVEAPISVDRIVISTIPSQSNELTYTGQSQTPTWNNYDADKMTIGGAQSGTTAGTYEATFTPKPQYKWSDGTTSTKTVSWTINKAAGTSSIDKSSVTVNNSNPTATVNVTRTGTGAVSASSNDTGVATVSVSGTTVTITGKATGTCTVTINVSADNNYTAPTSKTVSVSASIISPTLANNTWADVRAVSDAGQGANYWSVGDTKDVQIIGTVQGKSLNVTLKAFILGFNHNAGREGTNRIHFQLGKIGTTDIAFVDSNYGKTGASAGFRMNISSTNSGGWNGSYGRKTLLGNSGTPSNPPADSLLAAFPSDLRAVMKTVTKYTDNTGNTSNTSGDVTSTTDYLFFLAEFEVHGARSGANQYEQDSQAQYDYYKAGNSTVKYKHDATTTNCAWWCRSPGSLYNNSFCRVHPDGTADTTNAYNSWGLAPGFCV